MGTWVGGREELTSKDVTLLLYQNRALEQTLVKMPAPWAGLVPCPLPPQQTPEPAYPASPAFPPLSCPFASRVVYQDGFYGAEIYVSAALGEGTWAWHSVSPLPGPAPSPHPTLSLEPRRAPPAQSTVSLGAPPRLSLVSPASWGALMALPAQGAKARFSTSQALCDGGSG